MQLIAHYIFFDDVTEMDLQDQYDRLLKPQSMRNDNNDLTDSIDSEITQSLLKRTIIDSDHLYDFRQQLICFKYSNEFFSLLVRSPLLTLLVLHYEFKRNKFGISIQFRDTALKRVMMIQIMLPECYICPLLVYNIDSIHPWWFVIADFVSTALKQRTAYNTINFYEWIKLDSTNKHWYELYNLPTLLIRKDKNGRRINNERVFLPLWPKEYRDKFKQMSNPQNCTRMRDIQPISEFADVYRRYQTMNQTMKLDESATDLSDSDLSDIVCSDSEDYLDELDDLADETIIVQDDQNNWNCCPTSWLFLITVFIIGELWSDFVFFLLNRLLNDYLMDD